MRIRWIPVGGFLLAAIACGGKLAPLSGERDGGTRPAEASVDGDDGSLPDGALPDGAPSDERGPPPVPVCTGENSQCIAPEAGVRWTGAAAIECQPEMYPGPWTLLLERYIGTSFQVVQKQVVQEPGFGATFYDTSGPPARLTYRVCVVVDSKTVQCGASFTTDGPTNCACEPTSCYLQTACNATIDDQCGGTIDCGACPNGGSCNPVNHTCCPMGFMSDGWGNCVCAPPWYCPLQDWQTSDCSCCLGCE